MFTTTPQNVMKYVDFMDKIGSIKVKPDSWKDMFFPNVQACRAADVPGARTPDRPCEDPHGDTLKDAANAAPVAFAAAHAGAATGMSPAPQLDVRGVTLQYKTKEHLVTATYRVDFQVYKSDRFVLLGPVGLRQVDAAEGRGRLPGAGRRRDPPEGQAGHAARARPHDGVPGVRPAAAVEDGQART